MPGAGRKKSARDAIRVVIPSRGRAGRVTSHKVVPEATLAVPEEEAKEYGEHHDCEIVERPKLTGWAEIVNWIMDTFTEEVLFVMDDDVEGVYALPLEAYKLQRRKLHPNGVMQLIENTAEIAAGFNAPLFGYNVSANPAWVKSYDPIKLVGHIETAFGIVGRGVRADERLRSKGGGIDISLAALLTRRVVVKDQRFNFMNKRGINVGGLSLIRQKDREDWETELVLRKWGRYVAHTKKKQPGSPFSPVRTAWKIGVRRRQTLDL